MESNSAHLEKRPIKGASKINMITDADEERDIKEKLGLKHKNDETFLNIVFGILAIAGLTLFALFISTL